MKKKLIILMIAQGYPNGVIVRETPSNLYPIRSWRAQ